MKRSAENVTHHYVRHRFTTRLRDRTGNRGPTQSSGRTRAPVQIRAAYSRSKRSRVITLCHVSTKSCTNFSSPSAAP
ncbi:hypothetical protein E6P09_02365 [Haloferax mediterranei ATCC 33500]|uniref:Uncharacterized protein n=1 Tax=Haloferax mediterranei (strain ATCC 33500 / DSM 1411 / JCM 8866 / NBRC 14739 / NCIMB 2177 / R-4) TaxID=523841 RepID=A0A4P8P1F2_HALMT|nr:hypothetical protein E6P09_02365 [Haloferax mediterranei ATCC 33500]